MPHRTRILGNSPENRLASTGLATEFAGGFGRSDEPPGVVNVAISVAGSNKGLCGDI